MRNRILTVRERHYKYGKEEKEVGLGISGSTLMVSKMERYRQKEREDRETDRDRYLPRYLNYIYNLIGCIYVVILYGPAM